MKSSTNEDRIAIKIKAKESLHAFYERRKVENVDLTDEDQTDSMRDIKTIASPTNELICMVKEWMIKMMFIVFVLHLKLNGSACIWRKWAWWMLQYLMTEIVS